jgi:U3 small nucleolar RNA-associated protein 11
MTRSTRHSWTPVCFPRGQEERGGSQDILYSRKVRKKVFSSLCQKVALTKYCIAKKLGSKRKRTIEEPSHSEEVQQDLGWASTAPKKKSKKEVVESSPQVDEDAQETQTLARESKKRLLKELSARLVRDRSLRYAQREFELQRLMMGKGGRKKIQGVEKVEGGNDEDEEDQDEIDARKGRRRKSSQKVDETNYKPRVYKWRLERKR